MTIFIRYILLALSFLLVAYFITTVNTFANSPVSNTIIEDVSPEPKPDFNPCTEKERC